MAARRGDIVSRLRHAFAVDPPGPTALSDDERQLVDAVCRQVVRRRLVTPALMLLEMGRPLNFVGSQLMRFFQPFVAAVLPTGGYERFAALLARRGSIEALVARLETLEAEAEEARTAARRPAEPPGADADQPADDASEDDGHADG